MVTSPDLNIGLIGCGTVGGGVVRILRNSADLLTQRTGRTLKLTRVAVKNPAKQRDVDLSGIPVSTDAQAIIADPAIHVVIHVVGGIEPARSDIMALLRAGKDIITANKLCSMLMGLSCFNWRRRLAARSVLKLRSLAAFR